MTIKTTAKQTDLEKSGRDRRYASGVRPGRRVGYLPQMPDPCSYQSDVWNGTDVARISLVSPLTAFRAHSRLLLPRHLVACPMCEPTVGEFVWASALGDGNDLVHFRAPRVTCGQCLINGFIADVVCVVDVERPLAYGSAAGTVGVAWVGRGSAHMRLWVEGAMMPLVGLFMCVGVCRWASWHPCQKKSEADG